MTSTLEAHGVWNMIREDLFTADASDLSDAIDPFGKPLPTCVWNELRDDEGEIYALETMISHEGRAIRLRIYND